MIIVIFLLAMNFETSAQEANSKIIDVDLTSWFSKALDFKGIAVQDNKWQIWGCSPIIGPEGKTHLFVSTHMEY